MRKEDFLKYNELALEIEELVKEIGPLVIPNGKGTFWFEEIDTAEGGRVWFHYTNPKKAEDINIESGYFPLCFLWTPIEEIKKISVNITKEYKENISIAHDKDEDSWRQKRIEKYAKDNIYE